MMDIFGINAGFLFIQLSFLFVLLGLPVVSLIHLGKKKINDTPLALWVLIICAVPLMGPIAYWIIKPIAENNI